ncbi:MAG: hypothetical protein ACLRJV_14240 [Eubacteriales bacterium]
MSHHLKNLKRSGLITSRREERGLLHLIQHSPAKLLHKTVDALFEISCPTD